MARHAPIITQLFDSFLGTQEGIHSIIMPDVFSAGGSKNLWLDKYGRAKRILGYTSVSEPVTTDTGNSATRVRALFPYRKTSGGSVTRHLMGVFDDATNEIELKYSTDDGGTWTHLHDYGATCINQIPDFAQFGDELFITIGKAGVKAWDGTTLTDAGGDQSPQPTTASGGTGVLNGNYQYKLVSIVATTGARDPGSLSSDVLPLEDKRVDVSWTADADVSIGGYELYRTSGTGKIYYFVAYIDGRTTVAYTDNMSDEELIERRILQEHGDAPPQVYFCEPHGQRMWYLRTDDNPQEAYFSDAGDPDSVYEENRIQFKDAETEGDVIVGAKGDFQGSLVVFQEKSVWTLSGTGQVIGTINDFARSRTDAEVGTVHHRTVARVPAGAKFIDQEGKLVTTQSATLAYLTPYADIRLFDGNNDTIISHPKTTQLQGLNYLHRAKSWCVQDARRGEITWGFPAGSEGEPSSAVTWNYRWGVWYEREWGFSCAIEQDGAGTTSMLLAGSGSLTVGGIIYELWDGHSFDGEPFRAQWMTKAIYGLNERGQPAISHRKRFRWVDFMFETEQAVTLTLEWLPGNAIDAAAPIGAVTFSPASATVLSDDGDTLTSDDGDEVVVSQASALARLKLFADGRYYHDTGMRLRIYDDASAGSWSMEAFNLAYQILEGVKREPGEID